MINMTDRADVDVGLVALEDGGVASGRVDILLGSPVAQRALDWTTARGAQGARCAEEGTSERHDDPIPHPRLEGKEGSRW